jgi:hypothetical protein
MDIGLSFWIIAIIDAAALRSVYSGKPNKARDAWIGSAERSTWITPAIPDPSTWDDVRLRTQAEGAALVRERS